MKYDTAKAASFTKKLDDILRKNTVDVLADIHNRNPHEFGFEDAFFRVWVQQIVDMLNFIVEQVDVAETPIYLGIGDFYQYVYRLVDLLPEWVVSDDLVYLLQNELYQRFYEKSCFFIDESAEVILLQKLVAFRYAVF